VLAAPGIPPTDLLDAQDAKEVGAAIGNIVVDNILHFYNNAHWLWYIFSLMVWRLMLHFTPQRLRDKPFLMLGMAIVLNLVASQIPYGFCSFQHICSFYLYFLAGYYARRYEGLQWLRSQSWKVALGILWVYAVVVVTTGIGMQEMYLSPWLVYGSFGTPRALFAVYRICAYLFQIPITLAVLRLGLNTQNVTLDGKNTMFYYIYHWYFVFLLRYVVMKMGLTPNFWEASLCAIIIIVILYGLSKFRFLHKPLEFYR
jgi:hypothetical protein